MTDVGNECNNGFESIKDKTTCEVAAKDLLTTRLSFQDWYTRSKVLSEAKGKHFMNGCHWVVNGSEMLFNQFGFDGNCSSTVHPILADCRTLCKRKGIVTDINIVE